VLHGRGFRRAAAPDCEDSSGESSPDLAQSALFAATFADKLRTVIKNRIKSSAILPPSVKGVVIFSPNWLLSFNTGCRFGGGSADQGRRMKQK
jgi:hypothetical protein